MNGPRKSWWRGVGLFAGAVALTATSIVGAYAAPGGVPGKPGGTPGGGGGGGGGEPPVEEVGNSLSVPAVFVPDLTGAPTLNFACGDPVAPSGDTLTFPTDFTLPMAGVPAGEYYIQGVSEWQAGCTTAAVDTLVATADWGDNLSGDASLKVGSPVRVEVGLFAPAGYSLTGFEVLKLTDELDRLATYGTQGTAVNPYGEVRVWAKDAQFEITGPVVLTLQAMGAEINATGRVVYGYNWRPTAAGDYTIHFTAPSVGVDTSIAVDVAGSAGGGGGGGGGGGPR